jgi:hypothetical protein
MLKSKITLFAAGLLIIANSCSKDNQDILIETDEFVPHTITATIEPTDAKTCIDESTLDKGDEVSLFWTPGDVIGVFTDSESNLKYINSKTTANSDVAIFESTTTVKGTPRYAYYPYSSTAGTNPASISGTVPQVQTMNLMTGSLPGDYKYGTYDGEATNGSNFRFRHLFSIVRVNVDATYTALAGERILGVEMSVTRDGQPVPISGDFTFDATTGSYTLGDSVSNTIMLDWTTSPILEKNSTVTGYASMFPEIKRGDVLNFVVTTSNHTATFSVTSKVNFYKEYFYTFPLTIADFHETIVVKNRQTVSGTFTCATYNVDGLPDLSYIIGSVNPDGPGSEGTKTISQKIAESNWDFVGFSEDFDNHDELVSSLSHFTFGEYLGNVSSKALTGTVFDTDGLGFATNNYTCAFSNYERILFGDKAYGGLTGGANTCIKKAFRYYLVTLADGTEIDVYITHMNTYSEKSSSYINAQHNQLKMIAEHIKSNRNKRPVIFMGDTNLRYTRHDFKTYFWDVLNADYLTINDPWVDYMWDGVYPEHGGKSLVVESATGTDPDLDIIYSNQMGEVVDKIIYINDKEAPVQIKANSYLRDPEYKGLADHWPVVAEFYYERTY